jgi:hypothetical protein
MLLEPTIDTVREVVKKTGCKLATGFWGTRYNGCVVTALFFGSGGDRVMRCGLPDYRRKWAENLFGSRFTAGLMAGFDFGEDDAMNHMDKGYLRGYALGCQVRKEFVK